MSVLTQREGVAGDPCGQPVDRDRREVARGPEYLNRMTYAWGGDRA
jgi:hypothetical protein